ncbi:MAG: LemA family protein [Bacteroidales bacterium]
MTKSLKILVVILVLVAIISWLAGIYNGMVKGQERVESQWAQVENVYQRRADLIPNLVATVKGYADFERQTLTDVIDARAKATSVNINPQNLDENSLQRFQEAQNELTGALSRLMVVVERYPELKANQNFLELQSQLEGTENRIAVERNRFNEVAQQYNTLIRTFPRNIFASLFGFERKPYFEADQEASKPPKVEF